MDYFMKPTYEELDTWIAIKGRWTAFTLLQCGAYLKKGQIKLFRQFAGQGLDPEVLNNKYEKIVYFTDDLKAFIRDEISKEDLIKKIEEEISKM